MHRQINEKLRLWLRSLVYEYQIRADWGKEQSSIIKMRINRWTRQITILEETVIQGGY
jgi:hypothetical protein